jgi:hypothetical protein
LDAYATYTFHGSGSSVMPPLTTRCGPRAGLRLRKTGNSARPSARKSELETSLSARAAEYESELVVEQIDHGRWRAAVEDDGGMLKALETGIDAFAVARSEYRNALVHAGLFTASYDVDGIDMPGVALKGASRRERMIRDASELDAEAQVIEDCSGQLGHARTAISRFLNPT